MDKATQDRIATLHPKVRQEGQLIYNEICAALSGKAMCRFAYTMRTFDEQAALYAQGRTKLFDAAGKKLGVVTKANAGQSWHNYGLAIDIVLLKDTDGNGTFETASWEDTVDFDKDGKADWQEIVAIFKKYGWDWGGAWTGFKDKPHFEKRFGMTTAQAIAKHNAKDFIAGTTYINI